LRFHPIGAGSAGLNRRPARPILSAWTALASSAALAVGMLGFVGAGAAQAAPAAHTAHQAAAHHKKRPTPSRIHVDYKRACPVAKSGRMACLSLIRTNVAHIAPHTLAPNAAPVGVGFGPNSLQSAYVLPSSTAGSGQTVAVVDAFNDPNAASDLATYRS
jgi:hypothetical protein